MPGAMIKVAVPRQDDERQQIQHQTDAERREVLVEMLSLQPAGKASWQLRQCHRAQLGSGRAPRRDITGTVRTRQLSEQRHLATTGGSAQARFNQ